MDDSFNLETVSVPQKKARRGGELKTVVSLFVEPSFDPFNEPEIIEILSGSDGSQSVHESEDDYFSDSGDNSWAFGMVPVNTPQVQSTSIDYSQTKAEQLSFEDIPILYQTPQEATRSDRWFVVERRSEPLADSDTTGFGETPLIESIQLWKRGEYGCGLHSTLDRCPHYDIDKVTLNRLQRVATG